MIKDKLIKKAMDMGAEKATILPIDKVVFDKRTLLKCLFGCSGGYHYCPTVNDSVNVDNYQEMVRQYEYAILICTDNLKGGQNISLALESEAFISGYHFAFATTECKICKTCSRVDGEACRSPKHKRIPLYALGIDVYKTVRNVGWELEVVKERGLPRKNITAVFVE